MFGHKSQEQNFLQAKLGPEVGDVPNQLRVMLVGKGSMIAEEDVISRKYYSCTVKCYSQEGTVYVLDKDHFMRIRNQEESWMQVLEKALWKEKRKKGDYITSKPLKRKPEEPIKEEEEQPSQAEHMANDRIKQVTKNRLSNNDVSFDHKKLSYIQTQG